MGIYNNCYYLLGKIFKKLNISSAKIPKFLFLNNLGKNHTVEENLKYLNTISPNNGKSAIKTLSGLKEKKYDIQIIVPAYNVEEFIETCIDSILSQKTNCNYIVTIINDGSTDSTGLLLEKYNNCSNVEIITQDNKGFSGARNAGLSDIKAYYIMFVDSDDKLTDSSLQILFEKIKSRDPESIDQQYDIIQGGYNIINEEDIFVKYVSPIKNKQFGFPWGKIYKAEIFEKIQFPENFWFEDTINNLLIDSLIRGVKTVDYPVYDYRINTKGITYTSRGDSKVLDTLYITLSLLEDRKKLGIDPSQEFYETLLYQFRMNGRRLLSLKNKEINRRAFEIQRNVRTQFSHFKTQVEELKLLEWALNNNNLNAYYYALS